MKSVTFDNGRGFALGYDEAAPSPFVTWQFTETENGQRDYYWGHYHSNGQTAEKDFAKRIDDYKELFQVQERTGGREPAEYYRYYSTQRPVDLGTFPKSPGNAPVEIINFDERRMVEGGTMRAWGELLSPVLKIHDGTRGTVYKLCKVFLCPAFRLSLSLDLPA